MKIHAIWRGTKDNHETKEQLIRRLEYSWREVLLDPSIICDMYDEMETHLLNGAFIMSRDFERDKVGKRFILDREYEIDVKTRRNLRRHNLYWLLMEALAFQFGGGAGDYHHELKRKFMKPRIIMGRKGIMIEIAPSEAFDRCTEQEFTEYFDKVQRWIIEQGYSMDELLKYAE